jgi:hypothetical protein
MKLYMFRTVRLSIIKSLFVLHSAVVYVIQVCRQLSSRSICSSSKAVYKPVRHIPLLNEEWINSWWWIDELSETCRVSWQNKFVKLVHLLGFITKKFVTLHGNMNVKLAKVTLKWRHRRFALIHKIKSNDLFRQYNNKCNWDTDSDRSSHKHEQVFVQCSVYCCPILTELGSFLTHFSEHLTIFHTVPSSGSRAVPCRRTRHTKRHDKVFGRFSQLRDCASKFITDSTCCHVSNEFVTQWLTVQPTAL